MTCCFANELQSSFKQSYFAFHGVTMPPLRICPSGNQTYNRRPLLCRFVCFLHPIADFFPVRRIHKYNFIRPILREAINFFCEISFTFSVFRSSRWIERESKLLIKSVEKKLRRSPFWRCAAVMCVKFHIVTRGLTTHSTRAAIACLSSSFVPFRPRAVRTAALIRALARFFYKSKSFVT